MFERWGRELLDAGELAARLVMARARLPWRALPLRPADEGHAEVATGHPAHGSDASLPGFCSGGAVWDSAPVVDARRGLLYVGTGNNYTVPPGVCTKPGETGCTAPDTGDRIYSILALRLSTGATVWTDRTIDADVFSGACQPSAYGPDFDFGSAPNLFTIINPSTGLPEQLLGIGQKSGIYWAVRARHREDRLDHTSRALRQPWWHRVGSGDRRAPHLCRGSQLQLRSVHAGRLRPYAGQTVTGGSWAALDAAARSCPALR